MHPQQVLIALAAAVPFVAAAQPESDLGCFSQVPSLVQNEVYTFQNHGYCSQKCVKDNFRYAVLQEESCGCTNSAPTAQYKLAGSKCASPCAGFPNDNCGSADSFTVLNLSGLGFDDGESDSDDSSDDVITTAENTATPTASQTPTAVAKASANEDAGSAITTNGIIIPNSVSPDSIPTGILTAASSAGKETTTASSTLSTATHSTSSASSSSATPTPTGNAAGTLRAPVAGVFAVGLALVL